jgi:glutathione synthase/RimK-type ligase-like ATP-grasp enzyme
MKEIIALCDYKNKFGSKHFDQPYRSGMDKNLLIKRFAEKGFSIKFSYFHEIDFTDKVRFNKIPVIYTSSEDIGYRYKSYIEDIVMGLEELGANVIPRFRFLRANNNKVYMEILRDLILKENKFNSQHFGSLNDMLMVINDFRFPLVLKNAEGASGTGVFLVKNRTELIKLVKKMKDYFFPIEDIKDMLRPFIHKGYIRESVFRNKFIIQPLIPSLKNDWKVYVFGQKLYIFNRPIKKNRGIKASGGGYDNYFYGQEANAPQGIFDYSWEIFKKLNIPHASFDIAFDGNSFYLIEFQALYFGTAGIPYSKGYYIKNKSNWSFVEEKFTIEETYVDSIVWFIRK